MRLVTLGPLVLLLAAAAPQAADGPDLVRKLADAINAGKLPGKTDASKDGFKDGEKRIAWGNLDAGSLYKLLDSIGLKDDDLMALARWAWPAGLKKEAESTLAR
jgi:hypothetical protein